MAFCTRCAFCGEGTPTRKEAFDPSRAYYCSSKCARSGPRVKAKASGLKWFTPSKPCAKGHRCQRRTSNNGCMECERALETTRKLRHPDRHKRMYWANPGKKRAQAAAYRSENPEKLRAYEKRHYAENVVRKRESARQWRLANRARDLENQRRWKQENPDKWRVAWQTAKLRRRQVPGSYSAADIVAIMDAQRCKCAYCRKSLRAGFHTDHIVPVSKGGTSYPHNIQLLCAFCNISKHNRDPLDYARSTGRLL